MSHVNTRESLETGRRDSASPWKRWLALLSLVLLVLVPQAHSFLQHGLSPHLPHAVSRATLPMVFGANTQITDEDSPCTLCSVLGSANQLANYRFMRPVEETRKLPFAAGATFAPTQWSFDQFSRPPPSIPIGESAAG